MSSLGKRPVMFVFEPSALLSGADFLTVGKQYLFIDLNSWINLKTGIKTYQKSGNNNLTVIRSTKDLKVIKHIYWLKINEMHWTTGLTLYLVMFSCLWMLIIFFFLKNNGWLNQEHWCLVSGVLDSSFFSFFSMKDSERDPSFLIYSLKRWHCLTI